MVAMTYGTWELRGELPFETEQCRVGNPEAGVEPGLGPLGEVEQPYEVAGQQ